MASDTPFIRVKIECPICKTINEFELLRVGAYVEEGRDTDFSPKNIKWRYPKYQAYHPLVFFVATCANCHYSRELTNDYKDWRSDNKYRTFKLKAQKAKHLEELANADTVVRSLGEHVDVPRYPNESAIIKLHLAVYNELMYEYFSQLDLGRFYLRIGWLFRELERGDNPNAAILRTLLTDLSEEESRLGETIRQLVERRDAFTTALTKHFETEPIPTDLQAQMMTGGELLGESSTAFAQAVDTARSTFSDLTKQYETYRNGLVGTTDGSLVAPFGKWSSFDQFLRHLRERWDGIALSETDALQRAIYHYKRAFEDGRDIQPGNQQIQASYLIAELSRRVGDYDQAKQYFTSTIKNGQEFIYRNRDDKSRTALARKILELAVEQGRTNLAAAEPTAG